MNSRASTSSHPHPILGGLSAQEFLQKYWQKRPLFIPGALADFSNPLTPDELAGLACEDEVESRLVLEFAGPRPWTLEHGPFAEERFTKLPDTHWSLLVQECHKYIPELAALMARFDFVPAWRIDDVMASFAPPQGSVGPHVDQYDVFLIQAMGTRRWQINSQVTADGNFLPGVELNIMRDFTAEQEWLAQPGDILYLPPGVAHYGVAQDDCITLSVGFRAPSFQEIVSNFLDFAAEQIDPALRYRDPDLGLQPHPGEIEESARQKIRAVIRQAVADDHAIDEWFGQFVTAPKAIHPDDLSEHKIHPEYDSETLLDLFRNDGQLERGPGVRLAFIRHEGGITLFVDGESYPLGHDQLEAVALLCDQQHFQYPELAEALQDDGFLDLLTQLHNLGHLHLTNTEYDVQQVSWEDAEKPLRAIRTAVFVVEQNVPPAMEWDKQDKHAIHLLARDRERRPIGTARILNDGHIGRLAVISEYRGKGIGSALLKTAIKIARQHNMEKIALSAQTQALDFYRKFGFQAKGEVFMDAGIPHQEMVLGSTKLMHPEPAPAESPLALDDCKLGSSREYLPLRSRDHQRDTAVHMLQQATRTLRLFTHNLDATLYDTTEFIEAMKKLALAGPNTRIYILLQDPKDVVMHGHRIVELARRLSSHVFIHRADEEDQKRMENFMLVDLVGIIRRSYPGRYEGTASYHEPGEVRKYLKFFTEAWERSHPEPELRRLYI